MKLNVGDKIKSVEVILENNTTIQFPELGKKYILFFYPKDQSPGCINQVCNIRDVYSKLKAKGYIVLGCSPDTTKSHLNFIEKQKLPYSLIADTDMKLINLFNVWGPKKFMGKDYIGLYRTSFIINEKSEISNIIDKVKTKEAGIQVLDLIS